MAAINKITLTNLLESAFNAEADVLNNDPALARRRIAEKIANAIESYVVGRSTSGNSSDGATVNTTIQ